MSLYTKLVSNLIFPLQEKVKNHQSVKLRKALEHSQWLNATEIQALQNQKLQTFMARAYKVPYYRRLLDERGLKPEDFTSKDKLQTLPFLTKDIIKANTEDLKAPGAQSLKQFNTGGSSGTPLIFFLDEERVSHDVAAKWRATRWWGVDIGDKEIVAWGSPIELTGQDKLKMLRDAVFRSHLIPAFNMSKQQLLGFIDRIRTYKPKMLFGYPSVFDLIARTAKEHSIQMDNLGIKVAFVTSERLYDHQRENIEAVFGCPVANGYGGRDAGFIAHQCPSDGMHISAEDIVVEIIDEQGQPVPDGESGEIVVTHLATSSFPFIRYRTGDIGSLATETCACGRGLPMLQSIEGRTTDFVIAQNGTIMHGLSLIYILREMEEVAEFKVVQQSLDETDIMVVTKNGQLSDAALKQIESGFKQRLGDEVTINISQTDSIAAEKSGKFRYIQSKVSTSG